MADLLDWFHRLSLLIVEVDRSLFHKINREWTNLLFDRAMPWITSFNETKWVVVFFAIFLIYKLRAKAAVVIVGCALSILVADVTAARVVKPLVQRQRPEFSQATPRLLVPSATGWSFPSNHATNTFAVATFMGLTVIGSGPFAMLVAALVSYSRIYVGVHYPIDVIGGGILGFLCGLLVYYFFSGVQNFVFPQALETLPKKWRKRDYTKARKRA